MAHRRGSCHFVVIPFYCLLSTIVWIVSSRAAQAVEVRAVGPDGAGIARARITCDALPSFTVIADQNGSADVPAECATAMCNAPGLIAARATRTDAGSLCTLRPGVVVAGVVPGAACRTGCTLALSLSSAAGGGAKPAVLLRRSAGDPGGPFEFEAQPAGSYRLELTRTEDHWTCGVLLGLLAPGRARVDVTWREPATMRVRVTDEKMQPLAGVRVRAWSRLRGAGPRDPEPIGTWTCSGAAPLQPTVAPEPRETTSGPEGLAEIRPLDPAQEHLVVAGAWDAKPGIDARIEPEVPAAPDAEVALTPRAPAHVRGRVLDDADHAVKGKVALSPWGDSAAPWLARVLPPARLEDEIASKGSFGFDFALPGEYQVAVRGPEVLPLETARFALKPGETRDLGILRVPSGDRFTVQIRDEQRNPVPGANVVVDGESGLSVRRRATTNTEGVASVAALPPGSRILLLVTADRYAPYYVRSLEARQSPFAVELKRGAVVTGRVVDPWDAPVAGASVSYAIPREDVFGNDVSPHPVTTSDDGAFTLASVPAGEIVVSARAPRYASATPMKLTTVAGETQREVVLRLHPPDRVRGRVLDPGARGIEGARVLARLWYSVGAALDQPPVVETRSGADGAFELPCTNCRDLALIALAPGFAGASRRVEDPTEPLDLTLARGARLILKGPAPRPGLRGAQVEDGAGLQRLAIFDAHGRAELEDLAPGEGSAVLLSKGWNKSVPVPLQSGTTAEVELVLADSAIEGKVTVEGRPWPGAVIGANHQSGEEPYAVAIAHDGGGYELALPPGEIIVSVHAGGGAAGKRVVLRDGERQIVDLDITRVTADISVISAGDGAPVNPAFVYARASEPIPGCGGGGGAFMNPDEDTSGFHASGIDCNGATAATAADGRGVMRLSAPGTYEFTVRSEGFEPYTRTIQLQPGNNPVQLSIRRSARGLRIRLPEGVQAEIFCRRGKAMPFEARRPGEEPVCRSVPEGPVEAFVCVPGVGISRVTATVPAEGETVVDVTPRPGGRLVVPTTSSTPPTVVDLDGIDWSDPIFATCRPERPFVQLQGSWSWVFDGLPAGTYVASVNGSKRTPVEVIPGGTVIANEGAR